MGKLDQVLIVDNNCGRAQDIKKQISDAGICDNIKIAVNGEHALLCLDHLDLYMRMRDQKIMVLLNLDTPIMNGLDFLNGLNYRKYPGKEKILLVVMKDICSIESSEKARLKGITQFISTPIDVSSLNESINIHFEEKKKVKFRIPEVKPVKRPLTMN